MTFSCSLIGDRYFETLSSDCHNILIPNNYKWLNINGLPVFQWQFCLSDNKKWMKQLKIDLPNSLRVCVHQGYYNYVYQHEEYLE